MVEQLLKQCVCFNKVNKVSLDAFVVSLSTRIVVLHTTFTGKKPETLICQAPAYLRCCLDTSWQKEPLTNTAVFLVLLLNCLVQLCASV